MKTLAFWSTLGTVTLFATSGSAWIWEPDGETVYKTYCATCHELAGESPAPDRATLAKLSPEQIVAALERGVMSGQGQQRSRAEKRALAAFLSDQPFGVEPVNPIAASAFCAQTQGSVARPDSGPIWNGWGVSVSNTRFQPGEAAQLPAADVPRLKLKWAFGLPGATSASAQPIVFAGRVYVGSWSGDFFSLDAETGCIHWMFETESAVRSAASIGRAENGSVQVYFGDVAANVYSMDAESGTLNWKVKVDDFPLARVTGSPTLHEGRLYVPVASREESQAGNPNYPCCRFRGSLLALDAETGRQIWKTYTVAEPRPTGKNAIGTQLWGPSGSGIWVSPTLDLKQRALYVGTSNAYSYPPTTTSDAILAFDMDSGVIRWSRQMTLNDMWNGSCPERARDHSNCANRDAPDFDFAASPVLVDLENGKRLLVAGQKSGVVYGLDPDKEGDTVWSQRVGKGGTSGGVMFGPAADGNNVYVAITDGARIGQTRVYDPTIGGGMFALDLGTGEKRWETPAPGCGDRRPCNPTQAAAVTAIPDVVFSGSNDGFIRAYSTRDGRIVWEYDTARDFDTVNGVRANGGSINNGGPAVAGGMLFTNSGYSHHSGVMPGNVLLAFSSE